MCKVYYLTTKSYMSKSFSLRKRYRKRLQREQKQMTSSKIGRGHLIKTKIKARKSMLKKLQHVQHCLVINFSKWLLHG
jgi:hypothetical protein